MSRCIYEQLVPHLNTVFPFLHHSLHFSTFDLTAHLTLLLNLSKSIRRRSNSSWTSLNTEYSVVNILALALLLLTFVVAAPSGIHSHSLSSADDELILR